MRIEAIVRSPEATRRRAAGVGRGRGRLGAATVEFAVVAPLLALLTVGTLEVTRAVQVNLALTDAVRHACRLASEPRSDNDAVRKRVNGVLSGSRIDPARATVTIKVNNVSADLKTANEGDRVEVSVAVPVRDVSWVAPLIFSEDAKQVQRLAMMRQR
jgi:Flp pilus assembly protein TadG